MAIPNKVPLFAVATLFAAAASPTSAQMAITTIGATDAASCYEDAADQFSEDLTHCNEALDDRTMSKADRKKTLVNRGVILNRRGDYNEALVDFNAAIEIDSEIAEAYLNRGNTWFFAGRHDDAMADYEKSLALGISKPWAAWYNIGLIHDAKKEPEKAQEAYRKSLEFNPDFALAQRKIAE